MNDYSTSAYMKSTASDSNNNTVSKSKKFTRNPSPLAKCIAKAGDVNAGVLFHQVEYRFKARDTLWERDGHFWVAQTRECWCAEAGLTLKQYKRAKDILIKEKLIKVSHKKIRPHHRWETTFIRLRKSVDQTLHTVPTGSTHNGPHEVHNTVVPLGTYKEGENKEGENGKGNFADKPQKAKNTKIKKKQGGKKDKGVTCKEIEKVWLSAHETAFPDKSMTPFAGPDWNYVKILIEKLGNDAPAVVIANVTEWELFLMILKEENGLYNQGHSPCMKKLAHHADVALRVWKDNFIPDGEKLDDLDFEYSGEVHFGS